MKATQVLVHMTWALQTGAGELDGWPVEWLANSWVPHVDTGRPGPRGAARPSASTAG